MVLVSLGKGIRPIKTDLIYVKQLFPNSFFTAELRFSAYFTTLNHTKMNLIYISLIIYLFARIDDNTLDRGYYIFKHQNRWLLRSLTVVAISTTTLELLGFTLFFIATFDQVLNHLQEKDLMHLGNTAEWDKFFNSKPILYISVKVIALFLGVFLLIHEMKMPYLFIDIYKICNTLLS